MPINSFKSLGNHRHLSAFNREKYTKQYPSKWHVEKVHHIQITLEPIVILKNTREPR